jgi:hypothetical protein
MQKWHGAPFLEQVDFVAAFWKKYCLVHHLSLVKRAKCDYRASAAIFWSLLLSKGNIERNV